MRLHPWHDLPTGPDVPAELNAIIEIPRGSRNKYELDKASGLFLFDRLLYSAVHYPADYGLIPRTLADDDDPLDALVLITEATFPGCLIRVRPLGVFAMRDEKGRDEKLLAAPVRDPLYDEMRTLDDVPAHFLREVEHFFAIYKDLEGIETDVLGWHGPDAAHDVLNAARDRYVDEFGASEE